MNTEITRKAFTLKETATMLGVSYTTAFRLVKRGQIKSVNVLRTKLIPVSEIDRFLNVSGK